MGGLGAPELIIILLVVVLLFGAKKLPELARSLGKSVSEFKKGKDEGNETASNDAKQNPKDGNQQKSA